ncbi:hypothetical protein GGI25_001418 [Coemansia spiralis]|uniref:Uncharacterized protein n=2 Tax=Coemansia TaxID=4863 RepID=A0A9W8GAI5_9FUNG|nr:hypothetical protein BX070DRAFT_219119 [Coemansia spiralis]KAJ1994761.1 hypothetical protein EDC05_001383 [Coemansia umbellata]KAJ2624537.1 hypothetical protein GGI26_001456 [Coemansia sp. RSA 1358]KAJ2679495.1 hypothetical protein GGI25_001418 [Coemansia spiralis]
MRLLLYSFGLLVTLPAVLAGSADNCNLQYWKPRLMGTYMVDSRHMPRNRSFGEKISFFDELPEPKRLLEPQSPVKEKIIDPSRITVMVDSSHIVIDVDCF